MTDAAERDEQGRPAADRIIEGSCLCGGVAYRARGPLGAFARCYCVQCRKASGSENALNADVARGSFELLRGAERLREWESSPGQFRVFCGDCGSPLYKRYADDAERIRIRLGLLDRIVDGRPSLQVFASERLSCTAVDPSIPTFERGPDSERVR